MMNDTNEVNLNNTLLTANYMPRQRVDKIFDQVTQCKLVYVVAGAGYGKTQAVHHYIKQHPDAVVRWLQLTESDNIGSYYWEGLTHNISLDNPDLAVKLREFGFPETLSRFKQFASILKSTEHRSHKTFLVLDDFHLIHSKQALTFAERCAYLQIPGACVIIISRNEPEINAVSLFSKGAAGIITEDELRFTKDEIADFLKQCDIPFLLKDIPKFSNATKGWALAVKLLSMVLKRIPNNLDLAIETIKQNIFKLFEVEAFNDFPENVQKIMVKLSLLSDLPLAPLSVVSDDASFTQDTPQLASLMWFDNFIGDYRIHPLYLEYLQSRHNILTDKEKEETYQRAVQWCCENNFYMNAMNYYAKLREYKSMLEVLLSYPFKLPRDTCEYFLNILEKIDPDNKERTNQSVLLLKCLFIPVLLLGAGRYEEAEGRSFNVIREWENSDMPFSYNLLYTAYSNLAYINMYTCTATHKYNSLECLKKVVEYYRLSSIPPVEVKGAFAIADIRSFACLVGEGADKEKFNQFIEASRDTALYIAETHHNMYFGYEDLVACEVASFRNQPEMARNYAHRAILRSHEKGQYSIALMASGYLLRIAAQEGDYTLAKEILKQLRVYMDNPNFWNRQVLYDIFTGLFFAHIGLPEFVPSWLASDEKETASEVRIPIRELIIDVKFHIASEKYNQALTILCNSYPREPQERFLFGELTLSLLLAVARFKTGDTAGAVADFEKAYQLSFNGEFEMPFIELGKNLRPLIVAVSKQANCVIPKEWLETIERKASIFIKKTTVIRNAFKEEKNIETVQLSERELDVLKDLYHGLSREEIAANRYLSINTVKKMLQSIYIKLNANNNVDAIRIAMENKLVE